MALRKFLRGDLDWIVMKCLEKDRTRRYETAINLAADLERHLKHEPVAAGAPGAAYRVRKFVRRNRAAVSAATLVAVTLLAGIVGTTIGQIRANRARIDANRNADKARIAAEQARHAEASALGEKAFAQRQAYSANMLGASDALERGPISAARHYLQNAPADRRAWEWRHLSSRLDLSTRVHDQKSAISHLLVAPDGRSYYGVTRDSERTVQRWDIETGRLLQTISTDRPCRWFALAEGGKQLIMQLGDIPADAGTLEVWDPERGARISSRSLPARFVVSPDGSLVTYMVQNRIHVMSVPTGEVRVSPGNDGPVVCTSPDARRLAVQVRLGQIRLLDAESFQALSTFAAHQNVISAMVFSPDSALLASASIDGTVRITDVAANPPVAVATLRGHAGHVTGVRFSPDGSLAASYGMDRTVRLWDVRTGGARGVFQSEGIETGAMDFLPDGQTLISADGNGSVHFWDVQSSDAWILRGHHSYVYPVFVSPDGATIYSGGWDGFAGQPGCLRFWDAATGDPIAATGGADGYVRAGALSPDGSRLALSVVDARGVRIDVLDTATGATIASIAESLVEKSSFWVVSLAFDPTGRRLAWVTGKGVVVISDTQTGATLTSRRVFEGSGLPTCLAWSPDGTTLIPSHFDVDTLSLWDANALEPIRTWPHGHKGKVWSVAFSPDGRRMLTTAEDGIVRVWDAATGTRLHDLVGHGERVLCAAFSPDGKRIATGGNDNNVRLWDAETFDPVARLGGHEDYVYSLSWRADSQMLVSGSGDYTVRIWETQPLDDRMEARRERQAILLQVEPMVQRHFEELQDAAKVVEAVKADGSLTARARQVALQVALRLSLERQPAAMSRSHE